MISSHSRGSANISMIILEGRDKMIKPEKITYIDGEPSNGIKINWPRVVKYYKKVVTVKGYHNPLTVEPWKASYYLDLSDRSRGKTTNKLIVGLILFAMYGITTVYMRNRYDDLEPRNVSTLYDVIIDCQYLTKIFGEGSYNNMEYRSYKWYLTKTDEEGNVLAKSPDFCTFLMSTDRAMRYKSRLVLPKGDFIIYDEFIDPDYPPNTMELFQQNLKTVIRGRKSAVIMMSANTIDINSPWFYDFGIRREVLDMKQGDMKTIDKNGSVFIIEILAPDQSEQKKQYNKKYLGFAIGKKLQSISGESTWELRNYPHINKNWVMVRSFARNIYVQHLGDLLNFEVCEIEALGVIALCRPATRTYPDSIIYTCGEIRDTRFIYRCGDRNAPAGIIWRLYQQNKIFYANNQCGELLTNYIKNAQKLL